LGEIILGSNAGRTLQDQITVFKSVGNAIQDLAIAKFLIG
jgi:ornithine cyclodeaminase/alanine dehydrogenase-like protein (mu-crystallin family)